MANDFVQNLNDLMTATLNDACSHVDNGGLPFTVTILDINGHIIGKGINQVNELKDPTAHAEIQAIRNACKNSHRTHLKGNILLASGEPCAMCYLTALYSGLSHIFYAVSSEEVREFGFDYQNSYRLLWASPHAWSNPRVALLQVENRLEPFINYQNKLQYY